MGVAGGRLKPEGQARHSTPPKVEWVNVENKPYTGPYPSFLGDNGRPPQRDGGWPEISRIFWKTVIRMPHCTLWERTDWLYALETLFYHADCFDGSSFSSSKMSELRVREWKLGMTIDARIALRIRYIIGVRDNGQPVYEWKENREKAPKGGGEGNVAKISDYKAFYESVR